MNYSSFTGYCPVTERNETIATIYEHNKDVKRFVLMDMECDIQSCLKEECRVFEYALKFRKYL